MLSLKIDYKTRELVIRLDYELTLRQGNQRINEEGRLDLSELWTALKRAGEKSK
jgi:hypothetical protein